MAQSGKSNIPHKFASGETVEFNHYEPSYNSANGFSLAYTFRGSSSLTVTASVVDGSNFKITIAAASNTLSAGTFYVQAYATKGAERHLVFSGTVIVLPNLASGSGVYDGRNKYQIIVDALDAAITGRASKEQLSYTIGNRQIAFISLQEKKKLRDDYAILAANAIQRDRAGKGGSFFISVKVKFNR